MINGTKSAPSLRAGYVAGPRSQPMSSRARPWLVPPPDPLERVLDLGGSKAMRMMGVAMVVTLGFHGAAAARTAYIHAEVINWTLHLDRVIDNKLAQQFEIETEKAKVEVPPPEPKDDPVEKKALPKDAPAPIAKAAHIMAAEDTTPVDFTNTFIQGTSDSSPGGLVSATGTGTQHAVAAHVAPAGTGNGEAPKPQIVAVDLSRTAELAGSGEWRCPFPPEADSDQVDEASAIIQVTVGADGKAQGAAILQDPGHGFGREAKQCALREAYVPALDRSGNTVASSKKFRVKFER